MHGTYININIMKIFFQYVHLINKFFIALFDRRFLFGKYLAKKSVIKAQPKQTQVFVKSCKIVSMILDYHL